MIHTPKPRLFCNACEKPIPGLCTRCRKHPAIAPVPFELYDFPTDQIIKIGECGGCLLMKCGRPTCPTTTWRHVRRNYASGKTRAHVIFCGHTCSALSANELKRTSVEVACACGCGKKVLKQPAVIKRNRYVYYSQKHHWEHVRRLTEEKKRAELEREMDAVLCCYSDKCRGTPQEMRWMKYGNYQCTVCGVTRKSDLSRSEASKLNSEMAAMVTRD